MKRLFYILILLFTYNSLLAQISGTLDGDTLKADFSPYHVVGNVDVVDLVIEPGVTILFDGDYDFDIDRGVLIAKGFYNDSIIFKPDPSNSNGWRGLFFKQNVIPSELKYCRIEGSSRYGIKLDDGIAPIISNTKIVNNTTDGLEIKKSKMNLSNCIIENNTSNGLNLDDAQISIYNSIITRNDNTGILTNDNRDSLRIINSVIADNFGTGLLSIANAYISLKNSIIFYNGVEISTSSIADVTYSDIRGPSVYPGQGNINDPPHFSNFIIYPLSPMISPCIDVGNQDSLFNDVYFPPSLGTLRNDMGAYGGLLAGEWYPPLYIEFDTLDFGRVSYDSTISMAVKVKNYRDSTIIADSIYLVGNDSSMFELDTASLNVSVFDSTNINVSFTPDSQGLFAAIIVIETQKHGNFYLPVTGQGIVAEFNYSINQLDFGSVSLGDTVALDFPIINSGNDTLRVFQIHTNRAEFTVSGSFLNINPYNGRDTVFISYIPVSTDTLIDSLIMYTNDPDEGRASFPVYGQGFGPVLDINRNLFNFDSVLMTTDTNLTAEIYNFGNDTLFIFDIFISEDDSNSFSNLNDTTVFPRPIIPNRTFRFDINFSPSKLGADSAILNIHSDDAFNPIKLIDLNGVGVTPLIDLNTDTVDFGLIPLQTAVNETLLIYNNGNIDLILDPDSLMIFGNQKAFFNIDSISSTNISPGENSLLLLSFNADSAGIKQAELQIVSNDPFQNKSIISLFGECRSPVFSVSDTLLNYGDIVQDSISYLSATIYNDGQGELLIFEDSLFIYGPDSAFFEIVNVSNYQLAFQDTSVITIKFSAVKPQINQAFINLVTNDYNQSTKKIELTARVLIPFINIPNDTIDFGVVPLLSKKYESLIIYNQGFGPLTLYLDSLKISDQDSQYFKIENALSDTTIYPGDSVEVQLSYTAAAAGQQNTELEIKSNDAIRPSVSVILSGSSDTPQIVYTQSNIDFGSVAAFTDTTIILKIINIGFGNLILYKDNLYLSGVDTASFLITMADTNIVISSQDTFDFTIELNTEYVGPKSAELNFKSNDINDPNKTIPLSAFVYDNTEATVTIDDSHSNSEFILGQNANLRFIITTNFPTDSVIFNYREGGTIEFKKAYCTNLGQFNLWEIVIDSSWITTQGFEYYVKVYHGWTYTDWPYKPQSVPVLINNAFFPYKTNATSYQQISIPFNTADQTLSELFLDDLGGYDNTIYRFFDCVDGINYVELPNLDVNMTPGKSLWLITKNKIELDYSGAKTNPTDTSFQLALHSGWNMISTPFDFPVFWNAVSNSIQLWYYSGTGWQFASILEPHRGYAIEVSSDTTLSIPAREYNPVLNPKPISLTSDNNWSINLKLSQSNLEDYFNFAGVRENALRGIDIYDLAEPPPIGNNVSLYFTKLIGNSITKYATDYRNISSDGHVFNFEIFGNVTGMKKLSVETNNLPSEYKYIIVNPTTKIIYKPGEITLNKNQYQLKLIVGNSDFVYYNSDGYKEVPNTFELKQNYPNPFNPDTKIEIQIPEYTKISIYIYNILGQRVRKLINGRELDAGYYQFNWNGINDYGNQVATGIYILSLKSKQYSKSIKMILQR